MKKVYSSRQFDFYLPEFSKLELDFAGNIAAGFPSPAEGLSDDRIDLNKLLIKHPDATFYARAKGLSMNNDFQEGDILIIDRSEEWSDNKIALCFVDGEYTLKRISIKDGKCLLIPSNEVFPVLEMNSEVIIWGIVIFSIRKH
ncbi:LexA family protein [Proteiniphilum acetatigenes]|uniref:LexA family protein n=1 Tax=Proteiniphilum acetatigenes TaxID=294710 RepID=UPI00037F9641|nr:translesion error-prone DNA polymerase V autoproteolytic subunit [Proteiniphilum acetatigenes]